jgi:hypothetical protein
MPSNLRRLSEHRDVVVDPVGGIRIEGVWWSPKVHAKMQVKYASGMSWDAIRCYLRAECSTYRPVVRMKIGESRSPLCPTRRTPWLTVVLFGLAIVLGLYYLFGALVQGKPPLSIESW